MQVFIDARYNGPPDSANGGYACGLIAEAIDGIATVRLRVPPPLDRPMSLDGDGTTARLTDGETVVGEAETANLDGLVVPDPPSVEVADRSVPGYSGFTDHPFPTCYVCGPQREAGDGLRIFAGPVEGRPIVASPWTPDSSLADPTGRVAPRHLWAALDCPSYFAIEHKPRAVLGSLTTEIARVPRVGEELVAYGWHDRSDGRKHYSASALATSDGEVIGRASALWIEPKGGVPG